MAQPTNYIYQIKDTNGTAHYIWDNYAVHDVDSAFSDTSTNPVQNKLVTKYKQNALDIGSVGLTTSSEPYLGTLSSAVMTEINTHLIYNGQDLIFSATISSQTVVFRVSQTGAKVVNDYEYMIFTGTYGVPGSGADWQTKMCTVTINLTLGSIAVYPITVAVTSHTHGNITFDGYIQSSAVVSTTSDFLVFSDASNNGKIERQGFTAITSTLLNSLGEGSSPATANDYIICQYAGGGTSTTTYHRRKLSNVLGNVYWANVKVGTASSTSTSPIFNDMTSTTVKLRQSSSVTTVKAQMAYDSTEDAIKFTFE